MLKHGILGLLTYDAMTGYEIHELFQSSLNFFWTAQKSQIYRELHTLEKKGWITRQTIPQEGKPDKVVCALTDAGRQEFHRWLQMPDGMEMRSPLLMRTFFFGERSKEENIVYFQKMIGGLEMYKESLEPLKTLIPMYAFQTDAKDKAIYWQMTVDYGKMYLDMNIAWAKQCIEKLEAET